jgi:[lysine-biosynthesis-protein LysW]--L-2-aminoadipate ligase
LLVNEINHTMEFHTTQPISGIDLGQLIVEYALTVARRKTAGGISRRHAA